MHFKPTLVTIYSDTHLFSGCGNEVSTSTKDGSTAITKAYLEGTWSEECQFISSSSSSRKVVIVFYNSGDNATRSITSYSGTICNNKSFIVRNKIKNITVGNKSTLSTNQIVTKYTALVSDITIEPSTSAVATAFNTAAFCGLTSWGSGSETSVAGKTCSSSTSSFRNSSINDGFRDLVQMNSEKTYIRTGNTSNLGSDGYPSSLYANKYFKE